MRILFWVIFSCVPKHYFVKNKASLKHSCVQNHVFHPSPNKRSSICVRQGNNRRRDELLSIRPHSWIRSRMRALEVHIHSSLECVVDMPPGPSVVTVVRYFPASAVV